MLIIAITFGGVYSFLKLNPPLEIGTIASSEDNKSVVIGIGNKGFLEMKIVEVLVNDNEKASKIKVQVSNALQGFILTDDYKNEESKNYGFKNIEAVSIKGGTPPSSNFKKLDDGSASEKDEIYGISVIYSESIKSGSYKVSLLWDFI